MCSFMVCWSVVVIWTVRPSSIIIVLLMAVLNTSDALLQRHIAFKFTEVKAEVKDLKLYLVFSPTRSDG